MDIFKWDKNKKNFLIHNYPQQGKEWCANKLKCKESAVRYMASKLGLRLAQNSVIHKKRINKMAKTNTGKKRPNQSLVMKKLWEEGKILPPEKKTRTCSYCKKPFNWENSNNHRKTCSDECAKKRTTPNVGFPHPRGMLGKSHTEINKDKMGRRSKNMWADPDNVLNSQEYRASISSRNSLYHKQGKLGGHNTYSNCWRGWYIDDVNNKKYFMRSMWEYNYALYLQFLVDKKQIKGWGYEEDRFEFAGIKRGVMTYLPDFKVITNSGEIEYHEVKGYMDKKSKTKIKRMKKYFPKVNLIIIDSKTYKDIKTKLSRAIKGWVEKKEDLNASSNRNAPR